jgi:arylsulfatase A-like enzyme
MKFFSRLFCYHKGYYRNWMNAAGWTNYLRALASLATLVLLLLTTPCCGWRKSPPNILWVVWDTVRADRLSLYGNNHMTTPFLDAWARKACVFVDCVSPSSTTAPSHVSMFTGLIPSEHGTTHTKPAMSLACRSIAEILSNEGYRTYLFSANPYITAKNNYAQGFDTTEHPWSESYQQEALRILKSKLHPWENDTEGIYRTDNSNLAWLTQGCGELAQHAVSKWLTCSEQDKPFFIFLNYMEAHGPYVPPELYCRRMMNSEQMELLSKMRRPLFDMLLYSFNLKQFSREELDVIAGVYDAALAELDDLFKNLIFALDRSGHLKNTIVVLTSDHGEHLGEHHLLGHQYSLYNELLQVPLVIWYPKNIKPGRCSRPVMTTDIFPTLLELAGINIKGTGSQSLSLLSPTESRTRISEYPAWMQNTFIDSLPKKIPGCDLSHWMQSLKAVYSDRYKYISSSGGRQELYDLLSDPLENNNLAATQPAVVREMAELLETELARCQPVGGDVHRDAPLSEQERKQLETLGYL